MYNLLSKADFFWKYEMDSNLRLAAQFHEVVMFAATQNIKLQIKRKILKKLNEVIECKHSLRYRLSALNAISVIVPYLYKAESKYFLKTWAE